VSVVRYQDHLILSFDNGNDSLTLANWFTSEATKVERLEFADGTVWDVPAINNLLPPGTQLIGTYGGAVLPVVLDSGGTSATVGGLYKFEVPFSSGTWNVITLSAYWQYLQAAQAAGDSSSSVSKTIQGSAYGDNLYGGLGNDTLYGGGGDDMLAGANGNDLLYGGSGIDIMIGGAGWDQYWVDDPNDVVIEYTDNNWDWVYASCNYTLSANVEYLILQGNAREGKGNGLDNEIDANGLGNTLFGYGGNDILCGGLGDDALYGGDGDDSLNGWRGNDLLDGGSGDDLLQDSYGNSIMRGGAGNDHLVYEKGDGWEVNVLEGGEGNDTLDAFAGVSNTLVGGTGDDLLRGWNLYGNNRYFFNRGDGHDTIDIAGKLFFGSNTLVFAAGITPLDIQCSWSRVATYRWQSDWSGGGDFDGYYVIDRIYQNLELTIKDTGDRVTVHSWFDNQIAQQLQIQFADGTVWDAAWLFQNTSITGTDQDDRFLGREKGDFSLCGSGYNDVLDGRGGDDELYGLDGNDILSGGTGNDYLYGDLGNDTLDGGTGNDALEDDDGNDIYIFGRGYGQDRMYSWDENLSFTDIVRLQTGVAPTDIVVNKATDGSYDLVLSIEGTEDTLTISDFFNPEYGENCRIDAVEFADGTVWDVETLLAKIPADVILGTSGDDTLTGTAGNDILLGGAGNDLLIGGDGNDTYLFNPGDGVDRIVDSGGTDAIEFGAGITPDSLSLGLGSLLVRVGDQGEAIHLEDFNPDDPFNSSVIETFAFADGTVLDIAALLARGFDIQGTNGDDLLTGTAIIDRITGGEGADTLIGGPGDDLLAGGEGSDIYVFNLGDGVDTIVDVSSAAEGNLVSFKAGITASDLVFARDGNDLLISVGSQGDVVRLKDFDRFGNNGSLVAETLQFADGSRSGLFALANTAPVVGVTPENQTAFEDAAYSFTIPADTFTDADGGDSLACSATLGNGNSLPDWLVFDPAGRTFSGMPANGDVGILNLAVTATDTAGAAAVAGFALEIVNVNDAPTVAAQIPAQSATEDTSFSLTIPVDAFADVDAGDSLTYTASLADGSALPSWLGFDGAARTFSGTPASTSAGLWNVRVTATDKAGASAGSDFVLDVANHLAGTAASNILIGTAMRDVIEGLDGIDLLTGGDGNDTLKGGGGYDFLYGGKGNDTLQGGSESDALFGGDGTDILSGGASNDYLCGGTGDDTYIFNAGEGADTINNYDTTGFDTVSFGAGIGQSGVGLFRNGNNLEIGYSDADKVSVSNFFSSANYQVDEVNLADGFYLTAADINQIIQDMTAYAVDEGIALSSVNDVRNNEQLMSIVSNSWHA